MPQGDDTAVKGILKATHYGGPLQIYHMGPFARRISFATQQTRALNLIWALHSSKKIRAGHRVAVIGGGLAGVTAAASLAKLDCKVTLFERNDAVLLQQAGTRHRIVHPNINHWPEKPVHPTTELPIFDWFAAECAFAIGEISSDWASEIAKIQNVEVVPGVTVERHIPERDNRVSFRMSPNKSTESFDAAIITTGFAEERSLENYRHEFKSYWRPDDLEEDRDANSSRSFVVCGCGDGGLIDALRLAYKTKEFDRGNLAIRIAELLGPNSESSKIIRMAETEVKNYSMERAAYYLEAKYKESVKELAPDVRSLLELALFPKKGIVTLVGNEPTPYSLAAAPINKLLLTVAINEGRIEYGAGEWDKDYKGLFTGRDFELPKAFRTIVRLGAPLVLETTLGLISASALRTLKANQFAILEILDAPHWRGAPKPGYPGHPPYMPKSLDFIKARTPLARKYVSMTRPGATVSEGEDGFILYTEHAEPGPAFPETAFGIPLKPPTDQDTNADSV